MPPKAGGRAAAKEEEPSADAKEHVRLQDAAFDLGVLSRTRRLCTNSLPPTRLMQRAGGKDIVKKASTRKGRYLLVFNFQLAPAAAGRLGTLAALDSKNPVMYLDFPQGRYKLFGTLVFPRNKYCVLRLGQREVLCEDVLESMIVFSEAWWVGRAEDNPGEARLPDPDWLSQPQLHQKFDFSTRGTAAATGATGKEAEAGEEEEGDEDEEEPASQRPQRRASRAAGGKRLRYNEDSDGGGGEDEEDSEAEERAPRKLQRTGSQQGRAQRTSQAKQQPESHPIDLAGSSEEEEEPLAARGAKGQATLDAFLGKAAGASQQQQAPAAAPKSAGKAAAAKPAAKGGSTAKQRRAAAAEASGEESDFVDLAGSSDDEAAADEPPSSTRPRSQRQASGAAAKKLRVVDSGSESDGSEAGDASDSEGGSEAGGSGSGSDEGEDEIESGSSDGDGSDYAPSD